MVSWRSAHHLTGRFTRLAAHTTKTVSGNSLPRRPKPPPTSGDTTRTLSFGTLNAMVASAVCTRITPCVGEYSVWVCVASSQVARATLGSMVLPTTRLLTNSSATTLWARANAASTAVPSWLTQWTHELEPRSG